MFIRNGNIKVFVEMNIEGDPEVHLYGPLVSLYQWTVDGRRKTFLTICAVEDDDFDPDPDDKEPLGKPEEYVVEDVPKLRIVS